MKPALVYDLPTRLFHWIFAGLFLTAFLIAKNIDDESWLFTYHMLAGLSLCYLVLWRVIWGLVGSRYARFSNFALNPKELYRYLLGILRGDKRKWVGHNPASSWAALAMMLLALGLGITGFLMTSGPNKETFEDIHELFANAFMIVAILHVLGILVHTLRHREMIGLSMLSGRKNIAEPKLAIHSAHFGTAAAFIVLILSFAGFISFNFDSQKQSLNLFGTTLQLGEEAGESEQEGLTRPDANADEDGREQEGEDED